MEERISQSLIRDSKTRPNSGYKDSLELYLSYTPTRKTPLINIRLILRAKYTLRIQA